MTRFSIAFAASATALLLGASIGTAQTEPGASTAASETARPRHPFTVGETLTYDVKFGPIKAGEATMKIEGIEQLRGRDVYRAVFGIRGGVPFFRVRDSYESWFDVRDLSSLRHVQRIHEGGYKRNSDFQIFGDDGYYTENGGDRQPTTRQPLDDGNFLYFVRTVPLEVGKTYEFNRYFKTDRNPVTIKVLRRETVTVPAGTFETVVVQPLIKTKGIFSDKGQAEVWLTDDDRRMMVQMKSKLSFGSLNLYLTSFHTP